MKTPSKQPLRRAVWMAAILVLVALLASCRDIVLPTETGEPPATGEATETPITEATPDETPAATPSVTPSTLPGEFTPTPEVGTPVPVTQNLFQNPTFDGGDRPVTGGYVVWGWDPYGCNQEFIGHQCLAPRQGTGNPEGLEDRLSEWKVSQDWQDPFRQVSPTTSQQWFTFDGTSQSGIYQVINTIPGVPCVAGAYVMSWSDNGVTGDPHHSWLDTEDLIANSSWQILVQDGGSSDAFNEAMDAQRATAPVFRDTYDHFERIEIGFTPSSYQTTIFFENVRLWPFRSNDNYIDDAWAFCGSGLDAPAPPDPAPQPPDQPDYEPPTDDPLITVEKGKFRAENSQYIRSDHCTGTRCEVVGGLGAGQQTKYYGYWTNPDSGDIWLCVDEENAGWTQNPEFPTINIWQCSEWTAYKYKDSIMGSLSVGW